MAPLRTVTVLTGVISRSTAPLTSQFCLHLGRAGSFSGRLSYKGDVFNRHLITCELQPVNQTGGDGDGDGDGAVRVA